MTTTASKLFFGAAAVALLSAWAYGWGTGGGLTGVMLLGFKGGVGELMGYSVLIAAAGVLALLGSTTSILRDADPEVQAAVARLEVAPAVLAPATPSYWPALGATFAVVAIVGLVASPVLFVIGALGAAAVTVEWMVTAWSERATGDPGVNRQIRNRLMGPVEVPLFGALGIALVVVSFSRIFLALDKTGTSIVAIAIGAVILAVAFVIAYRPHLPKDAVATVVVIGLLLVLVAGIAAAATGTRTIEHHEEEHGSASLDTSELTL
jgi:hypothetical protein